MSDVGTWAWAERTHGRLSRRDRMELIRQGVIARLSRLAFRWRPPGVGSQRTLEFPVPPDSRLAREAEQHVRELSSPVLYGHCLRTWAFAALFAQRDAVAHDPELLYLACVLHDLGLTDAHNGQDATAACFAVEGARAADSLLRGWDLPAPRSVVVAEAICLHLNITVPGRMGAEAALLSKGVMLDVVGRRIEQLPSEQVSGVTTRWPRDGSGALLVDETKRQAAVRPDSRAALMQRLGFTELVAGHPLDGSVDLLTP